MACLRHPKILQLYGCSLTLQAIWIVSELCIRGRLLYIVECVYCTIYYTMYTVAIVYCYVYVYLYILCLRILILFPLIFSP